MEFKQTGWATFFNEAVTFSETFREEMSSQLLRDFYLILDISNEIKRHKFGLHVGMQPLQTTYKDDHGYAIVGILTPISLVKLVTAYWKPTNGEKAENATNLNIWNRQNIQFGWCADFDENDYVPYLKSRNKFNKEQLSTPFDIEYDYSLYPDLSLTICFNQKVVEDEIIQIEKILTEEIEDTYISELTNDDDVRESNDDNEVFGIFDFHSNDFSKSTKQLVEAFIKVGKSTVGNKITKVVIE